MRSIAAFFLPLAGLGVCVYFTMKADEGHELALLWAVAVAGAGLIVSAYAGAFIYFIGWMLNCNSKATNRRRCEAEERLHGATERLHGAAEQGDADAQCQLGYMYVNGKGVPEAEAVKWFRKAAEQGHSKSQCSLGVMYQYGIGVSQSDIEAYAWFSVSTTYGYEDAEQFLSEVKAELTPEQLGTAEERATAHEFSIRA